jgi:glycosyltransferase involved in cell wall biosynthesis
MPQNISGSLPFLPEQIRKFVGNLYMKQLANLFNKIDFVTAPTMTGIAILKANGVTIPMQVLSNGIDLSQFQKQSEKKQQTLRKRLQLPDKPIILYVGRLDKEKRVDVLVNALGLLANKVPFHAVIAGTGEQYDLLQALVQKLDLQNHITFLGMLSEEALLALYSLSAVFVMPSTAELQSLVTMEAMAIGKPVIGAKAGALPYLIDSGRNGYLFKPDDATDLAEKIEKIITNAKLQESMGEVSLQAVQKHDIHVVVSELEDLYKKVIANHKE